MYIDILPVGPLQANCYLLTCPDTHTAALIDPGWDDPTILKAISNRQADLKIIINTHAHFDHIGGNAAAVRETGASLALHEAELPILRENGGAAQWFIPLEPSPEPDRLLVPDEILKIGTLQLKVLFTPGHSPGHVSLYEEKYKAIFDGDVLFKEGIGRTDLPGGSLQTLMDSIRNVLFELPDDVLVYPGHGAPTTIGKERVSNPWLT